MLNSNYFIKFCFQIKSLKERESISTISRRTSKSVRALSMRKPKEMKMLMGEIWSQTKLLCKTPHLRNTILTCAIQFGLTTSYYTLMIWFPELFYRFEEYEDKYPGTSASVCDVSSVVLQNSTTG